MIPRHQQHLITTPAHLHEELEAAALRYAAMSPSDFKDDVLVVSASTLRDLGMISTETWCGVPAGGSVRVRRTSAGEMHAQVALPWQAATRDPGLAVRL